MSIPLIGRVLTRWKIQRSGIFVGGCPKQAVKQFTARIKALFRVGLLATVPVPAYSAFRGNVNSGEQPLLIARSPYRLLIHPTVFFALGYAAAKVLEGYPSNGSRAVPR